MGGDVPWKGRGPLGSGADALGCVFFFFLLFTSSFDGISMEGWSLSEVFLGMVGLLIPFIHPPVPYTWQSHESTQY